MARILVVYFSRAGENWASGGVRRVAVGNTRRAAEILARAIGADLFEIEPSRLYPDAYYPCTKVAQGELRRGERPAIRRPLPSLAGVTDLFVCAPIWWGTVPMAVFTALEGARGDGVRAHVLVTHEGSGLGRAPEEVWGALPGCRRGSAHALVGSRAAASEKELAAWARAALAA